MKSHTTLALFALLTVTFAGCGASDAIIDSQSTVGEVAATPITDSEKNVLPTTPEGWQAILTEEQFFVTREKGTEPSHTGEYWDNTDEGIYNCVCCGDALFDSATKYKSGTGWPSFWQPLDSQAIETEDDHGLFFTRTEVHCRKCKAHLGHVFEDGPQPTGLRYCMNSVSLKFVPAEKVATGDEK